MVFLDTDYGRASTPSFLMTYKLPHVTLQFFILMMMILLNYIVGQLHLRVFLKQEMKIWK